MKGGAFHPDKARGLGDIARKPPDLDGEIFALETFACLAQRDAHDRRQDAGEDAEGDRSKFTSATVMQNIKVLAIDQATRVGDDAQAVVGATATLEVRPQDSVLLAQAKSEGELSLSLMDDYGKLVRREL